MKTFRYLAAGRALLAPRLGDLTEVLEHDRNAVLIPPDDVEAAAGELRALLADGTRRQRLAAAARDDAHRFTWRRRAHAIDDFLHRVA